MPTSQVAPQPLWKIKKWTPYTMLVAKLQEDDKLFKSAPRGHLEESVGLKNTEVHQRGVGTQAVLPVETYNFRSALPGLKFMITDAEKLNGKNERQKGAQLEALKLYFYHMVNGKPTPKEMPVFDPKNKASSHTALQNRMSPPLYVTDSLGKLVDAYESLDGVITSIEQNASLSEALRMKMKIDKYREFISKMKLFSDYLDALKVCVTAL